MSLLFSQKRQNVALSSHSWEKILAPIMTSTPSIAQGNLTDLIIYTIIPSLYSETPQSKLHNVLKEPRVGVLT